VRKSCTLRIASVSAAGATIVPMRQPGVTVRPIRQITGTAEFSEVFFDGARTDADCIVGEPGDGWKVANGTLAFERGASTLGQNLLFRNELAEIIAAAKRNGAARALDRSERVAERSVPRFAPGDAVCTREMHPHGHTRLPRYARGKRGVVHRCHGIHVFPDTHAHGEGEQPQPLYSVRFDARELWGESAEPNEAVHIDLWESYLVPGR